MDERPVKKVKTEEPAGVPEPTESAAADGAGRLVPVTVEFKFRSCDTYLVDEGRLYGTLHVPMLQDTQTGRFRIAPGKTEVKGVNSYWGESFTSFFERPDAESPIENCTLGYHLKQWNDHRVLTDVINSSEEPDEQYHARYFEFQAYSNKPTERELCRRRLNDWEKNSGGMLTFFAQVEIEPDAIAPERSFDDTEEVRDYILECTWKADYKIKLYTVLSAHAPNEIANLKTEEGAKPNWDELEKLVAARFPDADYSWSKRAVENYRYFLDIKKDKKDWNSEKFSPSKAIDEVWHAHLSFPARYQHDMMAYCGHIIEHTPVLGNRALEQYKAAYTEHLKRMEEKFRNGTANGSFWSSWKQDFYDREFWPTPKKVREQFRESHDGDSDDCCAFPEQSQCG